MGMLRRSRRINGIVKLKIVVEKLQRSLLLVGRKSESLSSENYEEEEDAGDSSAVPADVKEGHFAVLAVDKEEPKRFVVPIHFLTHPTFLRLLEQAAEEYGFDHDGALTVPCRPSELERILAEEWEQDEEAGVAFRWGSSTETMVRRVRNNVVSSQFHDFQVQKPKKLLKYDTWT